MPVPVATTHANGVGNAGAVATELQTQGPFARLKQSAVAKSNEASDAAATLAKSSAAASIGSGPPTHGAEPQAASPGAAVEASIQTHDLSFQYPGIDGRPLPGAPHVVEQMSIELRPGSRCCLIGPNGAGKTSLLRILAGKHKVPVDSVRVLGRPPFYATELTTSGDVAYIGGNWERDIAFAGYSVPLQGGFSALEMIENVKDVAPARRDRLMKVLDVDPDWHMNRVSDGQRRRVQICMGLLRPFKVLLLDEVTVDLDVLGRADLMGFLRTECEEVGAAVVYATHIFDGLESWPTHLMYIANGRLQVFAPAETFPELKEGRLLSLVEGWLRAEKAERRRKQQAQPKRSGNDGQQLPAWNNGWYVLPSNFRLS